MADSALTSTHADAAAASGPRGWRDDRLLLKLLALAAASEAVYSVIVCLSWSFVFGESFEQRPFLPVLLCFAAAFAGYLAAIAVALRVQPRRRLTVVVLGGAMLFRGTLLVSEPIQEIDIYRYVWDGAATACGENPFRCSPAQVLAADATSPWPSDLKRLVEMRDRSPALREILGRIHYAELPTIYPPVSQALFALAELLTPAQATVSQRVFVMKAVVTAFDVATLLIVLRLLRLAGRHPGWVVAYAWCPLVMKEFANSGHLDSFAVFFTAAGICGVVKAVKRRPDARNNYHLGVSALLLGLAVGAKLYAVVLGPWMWITIASRLGARRATAAGLFFLAVATMSLLPMWMTKPAPNPQQEDVSASLQVPPSPAPEQPPPPQHDSLAGLRTFLRQWEINDFLFLIIVENLRPTDPTGRQPPVWFAILPDAWRRQAVEPVQGWLSVEVSQASFFIARALTTGAFLVVAGWLACRARTRASIDGTLEAAFPTLAWFWLFSPTQNPWYWSWALSLLPSARATAWRLVSGTCFLYYLRFWLTYHCPDQSVLSTPYNGPQFFDLVVTWIEHAPWLLILGIEFARRDIYGVVDDPTPDKGRESRHSAEAA